MDKVYVVTEGDYSDFHIEAIFATREEAQELVDRMNFCSKSEEIGFYSKNASVQEWELSKLTNKALWKVVFELVTNNAYGSVKDRMYCSYAYNQNEKESIKRYKDGGEDYEDVLMVRAKDGKHAEKIAIDRRTKWLAEKAGI